MQEKKKKEVICHLFQAESNWLAKVRISPIEMGQKKHGKICIYILVHV